MKIQWFYLILTVLIMLPPLPFSAAFQKSLLSMRRKNFASVRSAAGVWQNWADLIRAALGVYILTELALRVDSMRSGAELQAIMVKSAVLTLGVLIQTVRVVRTVQIVAPIFYLSGITLVLGGFTQGAFAVTVGWVFALVGKNLTYQLPAMLLALVAAGYVLGMGLPLMLNCGLIILPLVISVLFRKRLLFAAHLPAAA